MKNKKILILILISIILILGLLPLAIDWLMIGNNIPSNIGNSDWVVFLSGYIGAIIGAIVSLVGIIITIRYTNEQNKKDRELQIRPYCSIRYVHDNKLVGTNKIIGQFLLGCEPRQNNGPNYTSILYLKNIGLGPAVEFDFDVDEIDDGRKHYHPILVQKNADISNHSVNLLQPGEEAAFPICIYFNFDEITEDDFLNDPSGLTKYFLKTEVQQKYKNFDIVIHVKCHDMFMNTYHQKITLSSNMYIRRTTDSKQAEHLCDINLKEITIPSKCKNPQL